MGPENILSASLPSSSSQR